jgi:hypothetical protein
MLDLFQSYMESEFVEEGVGGWREKGLIDKQ